MTKIWKSVGFGLVMSGLFASSVFAQVDRGLTTKIQREFPNLNVQEVNTLPNVGLFEIRFKHSPRIAYTNREVTFFLVQGEVIDPRNMRNLTRDRETANVIKFYNELPFEKAISVKIGRGTRSIAIFTDPMCPFCKSTDKEIHEGLKGQDLTVHYFMNPLRIRGHEQSPLKAAKIWCSPNREQAWLDWMLRGVLPNNPGTCPNPVDETKSLATSLGFNSTPIILFDNGLVWQGAATAEDILRVLNQQR